MKLELNKTEERMLVDILETSLNQLQDEISHTDAYDYREMLKARKVVLQALKSKLH
ncbi:hypothetical protein [Malonomonas rubra]|uniref:hypothetical protein n=1 Tax=Malonomonas rubra TaxID=57040 RepID=UPI0026EA5312|nr:hypothetical protein [Malonomonas rubra]